MASCDGIDFVNNDDLVWQYCPTFAPAVLFAVLFFLTTAAHVIQAFIFKKACKKTTSSQSYKPFSWVIIVGSAWETIAYALRAAGAKDIYQKGFGLPHHILIALAPLWINAYVYMVLGRMVHFFLPDQRCFGISARRLTVIFVCLDIIAFLTQGASTSLLNSDTPSSIKIGIDLYMGGIGLQELFILIFAGLAVRFQSKMAIVEQRECPRSSWRPLLYTVYATLALITVRIIYRLVEYSGGLHSAIATNENAFYILDASPMFLALLALNIFHPGRFLVGPGSEFEKKPKKDKKRKNKNKLAGGKWTLDDNGQGHFEELPLDERGHEYDQHYHSFEPPER
ncbi:RTA1 domain-containing protein [Microsporum canis CBS 113480]|uniref:RTA1 domain-containing protein n=1 Tax=Arthroderma otae (strain ATCC MYA-4605 / CBS 113480) TaxID=554155 RepID=C5FS87_ARTOC|nr:RTA1 domain-containing protein [Microsporum canis CBS 113480]EEQ32740.1 RTA1 domain-containing protein [Microsporum canis CBS 113480]